MDVVGGPTEYVTIEFVGTRSYSLATCFGLWPAGDAYPAINVYNSTTPPQAGATSPPAGTLIANPQVAYEHNEPYLLDQTFTVNGDWTADANSAVGSGLNDVLNSVCGLANPNCTFTPDGPLRWGRGAWSAVDSLTSCKPLGTEEYDTLTYNKTSEQTASLTVGGGVTVGTELNLFNVVKSELEISVEAEHEWEEEKAFARSSMVLVPGGYTGTIWSAPNIGTITGTMVLRTNTATFTLFNFRQTRAGVTPPPDVCRPAGRRVQLHLERPGPQGDTQRACDGLSRPAGEERRHTGTGRRHGDPDAG